MAELEDFSMKVYKNEEEQRPVEEEERVENKEGQLKRLAKEREATGRRVPQRRELTNHRRAKRATLYGVQ